MGNGTSRGPPETSNHNHVECLPRHQEFMGGCDLLPEGQWCVDSTSPWEWTRPSPLSLSLSLSLSLGSMER